MLSLRSCRADLPSQLCDLAACDARCLGQGVTLNIAE